MYGVDLHQTRVNLKKKLVTYGVNLHQTRVTFKIKVSNVWC